MCGLPRLEQLVQGTLRPDLTLLLDAPAEVGQARGENAAVRAAPIGFEAERIEFFRKVRDKYLERARGAGRIEVIDATVDATQSPRRSKECSRGGSR